VNATSTESGSPFVQQVFERVRVALAGSSPDVVITDMHPLVGGRSSLTYSATASADGFSKRIVVKVAPPGVAPIRNRDVLRQARLLMSLLGSPIAVPQVLATDGGEPPDLPPLFVMDFVEGQSVEPLIAGPEQELPSATEVEVRGTRTAQMLAALHQLKPTQLRAAQAEPTIRFADEVRRWARAFSTVPDGLRVGTAECEARLMRALPKDLPPVVLHGDWRLGNMFCDGSEIKALIDWEIWSVSDPRIDLAWFTLMADPGCPDAVYRSSGLASPTRLQHEYEEIRGRVDDLEWFAALVRYKRAAVSALVAKNNLKKPAPEDHPRRMGEMVPMLIGQAVECLR
jgi:aminoglycoside phosphotransferase (APT) family kinase protein